MLLFFLYICIHTSFCTKYHTLAATQNVFMLYNMFPYPIHALQKFNLNIYLIQWYVVGFSFLTCLWRDRFWFCSNNWSFFSPMFYQIFESYFLLFECNFSMFWFCTDCFYCFFSNAWPFVCMYITCSLTSACIITFEHLHMITAILM